MSQFILRRNDWSIFIILLTVGILLIDIWIPLGFGIWELYAVPLWLAFRMPKSTPRLIWLVAVMGALFSVVEIGVSRPGGILLYAWFNRSLWAAILCAAAVVLTTARKNEAAVRESEERLRASEERHRLLTQAVPSIIYERSSDTGTYFYSDTWYEYTGLTPEQTAGDGWMQALHPEDLQRFRSRSATEEDPGVMHEWRMRFRRKDGQYRWMLVRSVPVREENGAIVRRVGAITDIDAMVNAQNALRKSEAQFRAMFEAAVVGQTQASAVTGQFTRVNQRFCEMTGYSEAELLQMRPRDLMHSTDIVGGLLPILEGRKDEVLREIRFLRKDGKLIWVNAAVRLLRDEDNKPTQTIAVYLDITPRKRAEEHRQRIVDGLSLAQQIVAAGIWDFDFANDEMYFSPAYYDLYGFHDGDRLSFERWLKCIVEEDRDRVSDAIRQLYKSGTDWNTEFRIEHPTRGQRWLASVGRLERNPERRRTRFTGMDIDITERKQMEAQLQDYVNVLRSSDRRKDEFLAVLGHELRNPLHAIRGAVDLLKILGVSGPDSDETRSIIDMQVNHMGRLIDDLLDVSRLTLDKLELRKEELDLADALEDAFNATRSVILTRNLHLETIMPQQKLILYGDRVRLTQVFANLLGNAAKYTPENGRIEVKVSRDADHGVVSVADNGIGISEESLHHLFDLFYQAQPQLESIASGLGIGLTLARRLIELHGGSIEARSDGLGKGSEFTVRLPLVKQREEEKDFTHVHDHESPMHRRILLVDDNRATTTVFSKLFKNLGCEVAAANDGIKAIELAASFRPEIVMLDLSMPRMDGYETCRRIRQQPGGKNIVLLAVTGLGGNETVNRARLAGFDDVIIKPIKADEILRLTHGNEPRNATRTSAKSSWES
ncbi:MAG TPA: PAS domain S-box protein [Phototrophicaceae bacterium]|nr:PAS domain S-box protein [Phototrophicaceae bacterium]